MHVLPQRRAAPPPAPCCGLRRSPRRSWRTARVNHSQSATPRMKPRAALRPVPSERLRATGPSSGCCRRRRRTSPGCATACAGRACANASTMRRHEQRAIEHRTRLVVRAAAWTSRSQRSTHRPCSHHAGARRRARAPAPGRTSARRPAAPCRPAARRTAACASAACPPVTATRFLRGQRAGDREHRHDQPEARRTTSQMPSAML